MDNSKNQHTTWTPQPITNKRLLKLQGKTFENLILYFAILDPLNFLYDHNKTQAPNHTETQTPKNKQNTKNRP